MIKCSHTFNVLDARGAVGFTERQALFGKMRDLSRKVAEAYVAQREEMGYPWLQSTVQMKSEAVSLPQSDNTDRADFLFEIGTEELPASELDRAIEQLQSAFETLLADIRLDHDGLHVNGTPRRLAVWVRNLQTRQAERTVELKGPPADRAFDSEGKPTKVAEGFARSKGLDLEQLTVKSFDNGRYVVAEVSESGRTSLDLLSEKLPQIITNLRFSKSMRWNQSGASFSRPVRWLMAILGDQVVPIEFAGLQSAEQPGGCAFQPSQVLKSTPWLIIKPIWTNRA